MTRIKTLHLKDFRNYKNATLEFSKHINLFIGKNGHGKTNCLEAIALMVSGKSFRTPHLKDLVAQSQQGFHVHCDFINNDIEQSLSFNYSSDKKTIHHNQTQYSRFIPLVGLIQGVFFAGFQDQLIKGSPQIRRRFLDLQNSQSDPTYLHHLGHFYKALKQRNFLLKEKEIASMDIYEELMSQNIPYLVSRRQKSIEEIQRLAQDIHHELSDNDEQLQLHYTSPFSPDSKPLNALECQQLIEGHRSRDLMMKHSLLGPHKEDLQIFLKELPAKKFASEGQIQTAMTSIYLAEYQRLKSQAKSPPLFCLDDLGQNLDPYRLKRLLQKLEGMGQIFITTPNLPDYTFNKPVKVFEINQGCVQQVK